jgi:hypothetical protein
VYYFSDSTPDLEIRFGLLPLIENIFDKMLNIFDIMTFMMYYDATKPHIQTMELQTDHR